MNLYFCDEINCAATFSTFEELEHHKTFDPHDVAEQRKGVERMKQYYAESVQGNRDSILQNQASTSSSNTSIIVGNKQLLKIKTGWALPQRKSVRFNKKQLQFIINIFLAGERSMCKQSPESVEVKMRSWRKDDGTKLFVRHEYMTRTQIKGLFAKYTKLTRQGKMDEAIQKITQMRWQDWEESDESNIEDYQAYEEVIGKPDTLYINISNLESVQYIMYDVGRYI